MSGTVLDLSPTVAGELLFCTAEGNVGRLSTDGSVAILATGADFPDPPRAVAETPGGDVAVAVYSGNLHLLPGGAAPPVLVYSDTYMVAEPTDLVVDSNGSFALASRTPSSGEYALDWVSADGGEWAYYLVAHEPTALAADPHGPGLIVADAQAGGALRAIDAGDPTHSTTPLDESTPFGFTVDAHDGDLAVEADGDVLAVGAGKLYHHDRATGITTVLASGMGTLRALAIGPSSPGVSSESGWSAFLAEGSGPTTIRELPGVGAPASAFATDLGTVPDEGLMVAFIGSVKGYDLAVDDGGDLLLGGDLWTGNKLVQRIALPSLSITTVVDSSQGVPGRVVGIVHAPDGTYYLATHEGEVVSYREGDAQVEVLLDDAANVVELGKDLAWTRDGSLWIADREAWGLGEIVRLEPDGTATGVVTTAETRGLAGDGLSGTLLASIWNDAGFAGTIEALDLGTSALTPLPGFAGMNYTNAGGWADGDVVVDVHGGVYSCSEDDFSVVRWDPEAGAPVRIGAGYAHRLAGLAIARSTPGALSETGWSLYVAEFNLLWEIPGVPAPAPPFVDPGAPPVGRVAGFFSPEIGVPRALAVEPCGTGLVIGTDAGILAHLDPASGVTTAVAGSAQGLTGDLVALATRPCKTIVAARADGVLYEVDPLAGWTATVIFDDPDDDLQAVRGIAIDGQDRVLVADGDAGSGCGRLWRLDGGALTPIARTAGGLRPAMDPLTGEVFVAETGGELLRVDAAAVPPRHGHHRGDAFTTFALTGEVGGIAFDAGGNLLLAEGDTGRIERIERGTGARTSLAGSYTRPRDLVVGAGTPGTAGALGASLFVLDGWVVYEHGLDSAAPPPPSAAAPGLAAPLELGVHGELVVGGTTLISIASPPDAGLMYVLVPTLSGKQPGFPISALGDPSDPRVLPANLDFTLNYIGDPAVLPLSVGTLDAAGSSPAGMGLVFPANPSLLGAQNFLDLTWIALEATAQSGIATVGATAQIWIGN